MQGLKSLLQAERMTRLDLAAAAGRMDQGKKQAGGGGFPGGGLCQEDFGGTNRLSGGGEEGRVKML